MKRKDLFANAFGMKERVEPLPSTGTTLNTIFIAKGFRAFNCARECVIHFTLRRTSGGREATITNGKMHALSSPLSAEVSTGSVSSGIRGEGKGNYSLELSSL